MTADSTPVEGVRVVLHRVGREEQGPVDSTGSDRRGRFSFAFAADTTALYLLSARYRGIEYFSPPVHTDPEQPDTGIRIVVADTSSTAAVSLEARHLVVTRPGEDGSRSILDLLVLLNRGRTTRVAPDSLRPTWSGPLPPGTVGLELGEGDFSPGAVSRRNDSLVLTAPLAPGEKQIMVQYLLPAGRATLELPFSDSVSSVSVLTEESNARVNGGSMAFADSQKVQGRDFHRWTGGMPAGASVRVVFPGVRDQTRWVLAGLVVVMVLVLMGAGRYVLVHRRSPGWDTNPDGTLAAIAALDARYAGREAEISGPEWAAYQRERARLKSRLEASLAADRPSP